VDQVERIGESDRIVAPIEVAPDHSRWRFVEFGPNKRAFYHYISRTCVSELSPEGYLIEDLQVDSN